VAACVAHPVAAGFVLAELLFGHLRVQPTDHLLVVFNYFVCIFYFVFQILDFALSGFDVVFRNL